MSQFYEYPRYKGLPAYMVAIIMEEALKEREAFRRVGFPMEALNEVASTRHLLELIERLSSAEGNVPGHRGRNLNLIMWLSGLAQQRLEEETTLADAAIHWALEHGKVPKLPDVYQVIAARQFGGKEILSARSEPVLRVRPDNSETSIETMVQETRDLLERGYPLAAWDVLATTTAGNRQNVLNALHAIGMREEDWIYFAGGRDRCILCYTEVTESNRAGVKGVDHGSFCPMSNYDFGRAEWGELELDREISPGIRKVPVVTDPRTVQLEAMSQT